MPHVKNFIHDTIRLSVYCILGYKIKSYSMFSGLTSFFFTLKIVIYRNMGRNAAVPYVHKRILRSYFCYKGPLYNKISLIKDLILF